LFLLGTIKDLTELQSCILKTVLEKRLAEAKDMCEEIEASFRNDHTERDAKILEEVNNPQTKDNIKEGGLRRSSGRGRGSKKRTTFRSSSSIPNDVLKLPAFDDMSVALRECKSSVEVRKWYKRECERSEKVKYEQIFDEEGTFTVDDVDWNVVSAKLVSIRKY